MVLISEELQALSTNDSNLKGRQINFLLESYDYEFLFITLKERIRRKHRIFVKNFE